MMTVSDEHTFEFNENIPRLMTQSLRCPKTNNHESDIESIAFE